MSETGTSVRRNRPATCSRRPATDALLVAAGRGDLDAFAAFYDATAPTILGLVGPMLEPERAERVVEQVYLVLWRSAPGFDPAVRSADAMLLHATRRVLVGPVGAVIADARAHRPRGRLRAGSATPRRRSARGETRS